MPMLTVSFSGIDVDVCRGVAAAVFGDDTKVKYTRSLQRTLHRFTVREVDLLSRNTTWTSSRDAGMGMALLASLITTALASLTHDKAGLKSAERTGWRYRLYSGGD